MDRGPRKKQGRVTPVVKDGFPAIRVPVAVAEKYSGFMQDLMKLNDQLWLDCTLEELDVLWEVTCYVLGLARVRLASMDELTPPSDTPVQ